VGSTAASVVAVGCGVAVCWGALVADAAATVGACVAGSEVGATAAAVSDVDVGLGVNAAWVCWTASVACAATTASEPRDSIAGIITFRTTSRITPTMISTSGTQTIRLRQAENSGSG
jgi:hypothetical protein